MNRRLFILLAGILAVGCIELDFFLFEAETAESIEEDYHGLPLFNDPEPPDWIEATDIERELYIRVPGAGEISPDALEGENNYLHGVFIHAPTDCGSDDCPLLDTGVTFIYQHGNSGHMFRYWYRAVALWNLGANVFIYTYRGYGLSRGEGDITRETVLEDAGVAMTYLRSRADVDPERIIAYGYSMGGIPTSYLVGESEHKNAFKACVLESAMDSPASSVNVATATDFPDGFFLDETPFDGPTFIGGASLPILHMHGGEDNRVVMEQAERYYNVLKDRPGYTHYLGKTDKPDEAWIALAAHRNVTIPAFAAEFHIADYYLDDKNPSHCCVHPLEYQNSAHTGFLQQIGETEGSSMTSTHDKYRNLLVGWVVQLLQ